MTIKSKLFGLVGVAALGMAVTTGIATAQTVDTDTIPASVQITCPTPMTVDIGGDTTFAPILDSINDHDTSTGVGAITVTVNMGCYWGPWQVNASTTSFVAAPFVWFGADHLSLEDPTVETYALEPIDFLGILEPEANPAYFSGPADEDTILETAENWLFYPFFPLPDSPAPFVTEASYTGVLSDLPPALPSGTYTAVLTVELAAD